MEKNTENKEKHESRYDKWVWDDGDLEENQELLYPKDIYDDYDPEAEDPYYYDKLLGRYNEDEEK